MARSLGKLWSIRNMTSPTVGSNCSLNTEAGSPNTDIKLGTDFEMPDDCITYLNTTDTPTAGSPFLERILRQTGKAWVYGTYASMIYALNESYNTMIGNSSDGNVVYDPGSFTLWDGDAGRFNFDASPGFPMQQCQLTITPGTYVNDFYESSWTLNTTCDITLN